MLLAEEPIAANAGRDRITAVRFEPGQDRTVWLVNLGGAREVYSLRGLANGPADPIPVATARCFSRRTRGAGGTRQPRGQLDGDRTLQQTIADSAACSRNRTRLRRTSIAGARLTSEGMRSCLTNREFS